MSPKCFLRFNGTHEEILVSLSSCLKPIFLSLFGIWIHFWSDVWLGCSAVSPSLFRLVVHKGSHCSDVGILVLRWILVKEDLHQFANPLLFPVMFISQPVGMTGGVGARCAIPILPILNKMVRKDIFDCSVTDVCLEK